MAALDRNVRHQVREELLRIHADLGTTFLLVTHDQDEALSISDRVALMANGRFEQIADPETLYHHPATLFAAKFIGAGSFVDGRVLECREGELDIDFHGIKFTAADAGVHGCASVTVLLRPEDLELVSPGDGRIDGRVETCTFFGSHYESTVRTDAALLRLHHRDPHWPGDNVAIKWGTSAGIAYPDEESARP